jgi:hypothetical protein
VLNEDETVREERTTVLKREKKQKKKRRKTKVCKNGAGEGQETGIGGLRMGEWGRTGKLKRRRDDNEE